MNKNLNPLNWKRSQQVVGGAIAILLVGAVTTGVAVNANQKAEEKKIEQLSKEKAKKAKQLEKSSEADSKKLLDIAEKTPTDKNIKLAEDSILKVKNAEVKKAFDNQVVNIKNRVKLENEAKTAVSNYQKDAMNQDKYKTAQQAISKLTSSYSKGVKDSLNKQLAVSKKQADDATKAQQAKSASDSKAKTADTNKQESASTGATNDNSNNANVATDTQNTANNDVASGSNSYDGGSQNNYSQDNSNSGSYNQGNSGQGNSNSNSNTNTGGNGSNSNSNTNTGGNGSNSNNGSNGGANTGQPSHTTKYVGWVSVDGVRTYSQTFDTIAEAQNYSASTANSSEVTELLLAGHSIRYGVEPVEV